MCLASGRVEGSQDRRKGRKTSRREGGREGKREGERERKREKASRQEGQDDISKVYAREYYDLSLDGKEGTKEHGISKVSKRNK